MITILGFIIGAIFYCVYLLYRNEATYKFRIKIVRNIPINNPNFDVIVNEFLSVSYYKMAFSLKPLTIKAFYPHTKYLKDIKLTDE